MKKPTAPSITSLPLSPDEERRRRMIKYSVAMGVRVVCLIVAVIVPGWWATVPLIGAIFLPYFAVVIANVSSDPRRGEVQRPGNILPVAPPVPGPRDDQQEDQ
ncbi:MULTISPECIES: DUF3099 domain-containing protein [unclassified Leifsonia]|jgi:hypothetical protein|uniref:DUF3099 domain-containing protein n=1 Tax=unclassified Leifsonia TaxID=2663824 RepID=UPI0008A722C5|nr:MULTISPECIES: DUF3099 domain-containing protein [unclassified Leifsonia]SEH95297.1 Protein of unknown function [Leifsonia sp. CL154]SFL57334.1 Protein of unknown function [Leifsonia sp. CL147]